jgi:hypothetical protein
LNGLAFNAIARHGSVYAAVAMPAAMGPTEEPLVKLKVTLTLLLMPA